FLHPEKLGSDDTTTLNFSGVMLGDKEASIPKGKIVSAWEGYVKLSDGAGFHTVDRIVVGADLPRSAVARVSDDFKVAPNGAWIDYYFYSKHLIVSLSPEKREVYTIRVGR